jgi:hypothetical protein
MEISAVLIVVKHATWRCAGPASLAISTKMEDVTSVLIPAHLVLMEFVSDVKTDFIYLGQFVTHVLITARPALQVLIASHV